MSLTNIGEVVRLWPTVGGLIALAAITSRRELLDLQYCEPADEVRETERLYRELWDHANHVTPLASAGSPVAERQRLRLISSA